VNNVFPHKINLCKPRLTVDTKTAQKQF